jgi:hypothetical protein
MPALAASISSSITEPLVCNHHEESSLWIILLDPYGVVNMGARHAKEWIGNQNHTPELMKTGLKVSNIDMLLCIMMIPCWCHRGSQQGQ